MAGENEDVEVVIEDDAVPAASEGRAPAAAPAGAPAAQPSADESIGVLKAQLEAERQGRKEAEAAAVQAASRAQDSDLAMVTSAIETVKQSQAGLRAAYADALAAQDWAAAAEINEKISGNSARLVELERGKAAMEARPKPVLRQDPTPSQAAEALARNLTPQSAAWVRAHPEYAIGAKREAMVGAHHIAVSHGFAVDTPEYFAKVEQLLGLGHSDERPVARNQTATQAEAPTAAAAQATGGRVAAPPEAPVSRTPTGHDGTKRTTTVRLTAAQREAAALSGMTEKEYAMQLVRARNEGKVN